MGAPPQRACDPPRRRVAAAVAVEGRSLRPPASLSRRRPVRHDDRSSPPQRRIRGARAGPAFARQLGSRGGRGAPRGRKGGARRACARRANRLARVARPGRARVLRGAAAQGEREEGRRPRLRRGPCAAGDAAAAAARASRAAPGGRRGHRQWAGPDGGGPRPALAGRRAAARSTSRRRPTAGPPRRPQVLTRDNPSLWPALTPAAQAEDTAGLLAWVPG